MNRKILFQVTAPAFLSGLLLVGTCLGSAWSIHRLQGNLGRVLSENVASVQASLDLEAKMRQVRYHALLYLIAPNPDELLEIEAAEQAFEEAFQAAVKSIDQENDLAESEAEKECIRQIQEGYEAYRADMSRLRAEVSKNGPRTDFATLARTHPIRHIVAPCQELGRLNREQLDQTVEDSTQTSSQARLALLLLGVGGPLGGLLCGYGLVRGLTRSIARLQVRVRDVVAAVSSCPEAPLGTRMTLGEIDLGSFTVKAEGDLAAIDQQLQHILTRVEEVTNRLQRQHQEFRRAEQLAAVGQLAASVAHEVRNPLTGMKLLVEAALPPRHPRRVRQPLSDEDLKVILGEITRLEKTVQHFLDFARPPTPERQLADLGAVVSRAVELIRSRARQQGVDVQVSLPPAPVMISLDSGQIGTVFVNLLLNALDALPRGGVVALTLTSGKGERPAQVTVRDNGPGIADEVVDRLFGPFISTKPTGTGLGLALSQTIVKEHGGNIRACNLPPEEGSGAVFTVSLPCAPIV